MGARWAWYAICPNGHEYSNFSGGADPCYECEEEPIVVVDCPHWADSDAKCDCAEVVREMAKNAEK